MEVCRLLLLVLSLVAMAACKDGFNLTLLHTNDIHAHIQEMNKYHSRCLAADASKGKCYGGLERLKTKIDELRKKYPDSLLLDGGDQYQGSLFFYIYGGQIMSHFMNILGYDAMTLGNHEFDNGPNGLIDFLENVTFPVVCSNLDLSKTPQLNPVKKSTVLNVSGEKIGIIGYLTTDTAAFADTGKVVFLDEVKSIQTEADKLKSQGVDKIIALGHAGYAKDKDIAHRVRGLDVVIGGHTNTFLYTGKAPANEVPEGPYPTIIKNPDGEEVLVVQDFAYGKYLGFLQVNFDNKGKITEWNGNPILLDKSVAKASEVTKVIEAYLPKVEDMMKQTVGHSYVSLQGDRSICRARECNMGNLMTDAMIRMSLKFSDAAQWNHVSIALMNGGGIRASIGKGNVTVSDWKTVMPFRNTVDLIEIKGKVLLEALEYSASRWVPKGELFGGFLQMSGLRVSYDMKRDKGKRVVKVRALCSECLVPKFEPLNMTKSYQVLISSFTAAGGDGYTMIKNNHTKLISGNTFSDELITYTEKNSPLTASLDGRIHFVDVDVDNSNDDCIGEATSVKSSLFLMLCGLVILNLIL